MMRAPSLGPLSRIGWLITLGVGLVRAGWPYLVVALGFGGLGVVLGLALAEAATWGPL